LHATFVRTKPEELLLIGHLALQRRDSGTLGKDSDVAMGRRFVKMVLYRFYQLKRPRDNGYGPFTELAAFTPYLLSHRNREQTSGSIGSFQRKYLAVLAIRNLRTRFCEKSVLTQHYYTWNAHRIQPERQCCIHHLEHPGYHRK
jgi:hypothetical protein